MESYKCWNKILINKFNLLEKIDKIKILKN